ncbi:MAG: DUF4097 family beta strand repeat-containing protein [Vallitaleaceae bacterium]|jgi:DUF4097 and DUF4098 domain-containing protein YvlB|nr:DUF4097 family beta strand repeat-containing protein [Vallitaleaceae bacterium]
MNNGKMIGLLGGLALVFLIVVVVSAITDAQNYEGDSVTFEYTDSFEMENQAIEVNFSSENIDIYQSNTGKLEVYFIRDCNSKDEYEEYQNNFDVNVTDSKVEISLDDIKHDRWRFNNFLSRLIAGNFNFESRLELGIPEGFEGDLIVTVSSGNIMIEDVSSTDMNVKASSGNIVVNDISTDQLELSASSGNIEVFSIDADNMLKAVTSSGRITIDGITCDELVLRATSGNISGEDIIANMTSADTSSGRLSLNGEMGEGEFGASSGNVEVTYTEIQGDIEAHASSGNVRFSIPKDTEFELFAEFSSGNFNTDFDLDHVDVGDHQYYGETKDANLGIQINISTSSGNSNLDEMH